MVRLSANTVALNEPMKLSMGELSAGELVAPPGLDVFTERGPALLQPVGTSGYYSTNLDPDFVAGSLAAEHARLALENDMLRLQCMQAAEAANAHVAMWRYQQQEQHQHEVGKHAKQASGRPRSSTLSSEQSTTASLESAECSSDASDCAGPKTTVMLRHLPKSLSRDMLMKLLDNEGFGCQYDFVYLPVDFASNVNMGYAFLNFVSEDQAQHFFDVFKGFSRWPMPSQKVCDVNWSAPHQGFEAHVLRFRNSPVMHESLPDENRPIVLKDGARITFPAPTQKLRLPRLRTSRKGAKLVDAPPM